MKNNKYETPEIKIISMEPDENIMNTTGTESLNSLGINMGSERW